MALFRFNNIFLSLGTAALLLSGCKKWEDHNEVTDPALTMNLYQKVQGTSGLGKFSELLVKSGYDKVLASSKNYTVFAPTDNAMAALDAATINDSAKLRLFVGNHITGQSLYTSAANGVRVPMLNGKYSRVNGKSIETAAITTADQFAKNGVLHIIDKILPALPNTWETLANNPFIPAKQKAYMLSLYRKVFDLRNAVQIGVNPVTGLPVYQPGTDSITTNLFWRDVQDPQDESKEFSLFVLTDAAWDAELAKFKPYFATSTVDSTNELTSWNVVKDLGTAADYGTSIPDTVLSRSGVKVPIEKLAIVRTIKTSNGTVYVLSKADVQPRHKFREIRIEAENYAATSHDRRGNTYFRDRYNPVTGADFTDMLVLGHGVASFTVTYRPRNLYSMKYRAYWVALNDYQAGAITQKLVIGTTTSATFPYVTVPLNNFNEVLLGEFTVPAYKSVMDVFLVSANNTTAATNSIVCDYIRLEPVFQ